MSLTWLESGTPFPPVEQALREPDGLLAAGLELTPERLHAAYRQGIFPWFNDGEPVLWWSPDPRMVLATNDFNCSHSLSKKLRQIERQAQSGHIRVCVDRAFEQVMAECAAPRAGQPGTWITAPVRQAYAQLHRQGLAHSVELWIDDTLSAGLYGVSLGRMFYGESMFTRLPDGSKIALAHLIAFLRRHDAPAIDCQQQTRHLGSLGARAMPRQDFKALLARLIPQPSLPWQAGQLRLDGSIIPFPA